MYALILYLFAIISHVNSTGKSFPGLLCTSVENRDVCDDDDDDDDSSSTILLLMTKVFTWLVFQSFILQFYIFDR